ncbi:MAG: hypothetical protein ACFE75_02480 [Candidatus Hodarchaeota archaeon]
MKEKDYSKKILEFLSINLAGTTSKAIARYIERDEAFTRVYLNRLKRRNKVYIMGKRGKHNIYHISARVFYEATIERLERENKQLKYLNEQWEKMLTSAINRVRFLEAKLGKKGITFPSLSKETREFEWKKLIKENKELKKELNIV